MAFRLQPLILQSALNLVATTFMCSTWFCIHESDQIDHENVVARRRKRKLGPEFWGCFYRQVHRQVHRGKLSCRAREHWCADSARGSNAYQCHGTTISKDTLMQDHRGESGAPSRRTSPSSSSSRSMAPRGAISCSLLPTTTRRRQALWVLEPIPPRARGRRL